MENPNLGDLPVQQVMSSPNATAARSRESGALDPVVNGVNPALDGHLDMDGEVTRMTTNTAVPTGLEVTGAAREGIDSSQVSATGDRGGQQTNQAMGSAPQPPASDFLRGPTGGLRTEGSRHMNVDPPTPGVSSVVSGMMKAVQTLPAAVEGLVSGRPSAASSQAGVAKVGDSVEYASVTSSVVRREASVQGPEPKAQGPALLDAETVRRLQQMHASAPHLYGMPTESPHLRPPSTSSSDIQMEVRRQLGEMMAVHEEESRRLRSQVEALVAENYELRMNFSEGVQNIQDRRANSRSWLVGQGGIPGLGWLGRGLGSIIGGTNPSPPRALEFQAQPSAPPLPPAVNRDPLDLDFKGQSGQSQHTGIATGLMDFRPIPPPPPPPTSQVTPHPREILSTEGVNAQPPPIPPVIPKVSGLVPRTDEMPGSIGEQGLGRGAKEASGVPERMRGLDQPPPEEAKGAQDSTLDPLNIVLTGMAQLQGLVTELATTPKNSTKPEVIKPGVSSLPELPHPGPEASLHFADWLHDSKPALSDVSDNSETLWQLVLDESDSWYKSYLRLRPMDRLVARPVASAELADPKWSRVSRRIESMILTAAPQVVRQEVSSARISGLLNVVCRLYCIYGPGGLAERELGLKNIQDPPVAANVQEVIDHLRRWRRWCTRMSELGGALPDCALRVKALSKMTKQVLQMHSEIAFRISLVRAELQVDLTPTDDKVEKLHAQLLSEFEAIKNRKERESDKDKPSPPPNAGAAKVKGIEAPDGSPNPKGPKTPKANPKTPTTPKNPAGVEGAATSKVPCSFYVSANGCKKGQECTFTHDWNAIPVNERQGRCKNCGDCKARTKEGNPKGGKGKGSGRD